MHIIIKSIIAPGHALLKPTVTMLLCGYRQNSERQPFHWSTSTSTWWPVIADRYDVVYNDFYWFSLLSRAKGYLSTLAT
jgi:hypothetical protein